MGLLELGTWLLLLVAERALRALVQVELAGRVGLLLLLASERPLRAIGVLRTGLVLRAWIRAEKTLRTNLGWADVRVGGSLLELARRAGLAELLLLAEGLRRTERALGVLLLLVWSLLLLLLPELALRSKHVVRALDRSLAGRDRLGRLPLLLRLNVE